MMEIDHEIQQCYLEELKTSDETLGVLLPNEETVSQRLTNPIVTTYIDTEKISFERLVFLNFSTVVATLTFFCKASNAELFLQKKRVGKSVILQLFL